jgi:hypothetical protein
MKINSSHLLWLRLLLVPPLLALRPIGAAGSNNSVKSKVTITSGETATTTAQKSKTSSDQARILTPRDIASMDEASLEYFIAHAGRLLKGDVAKDVAEMEQRLKRLKADRAALNRKLLLTASRTSSSDPAPKPTPKPLAVRHPIKHR